MVNKYTLQGIPYWGEFTHPPYLEKFSPHSRLALNEISIPQPKVNSPH